MSKVIHHIHPHVMGHNDHHDHDRHNQNNFNHNHNFFKHFSHDNNGNGVHSFSATYSNVNGHVKRHFSKNGHQVDPQDAMAQMKKMDQDMNRSFQQMDRAFGGLDDDFGGDFLGNDHHGNQHHPFRRLFGRRRHRNRDDGNLTDRIKNHK